MCSCASFDHAVITRGGSAQALQHLAVRPFLTHYRHPRTHLAFYFFAMALGKYNLGEWTWLNLADAVKIGHVIRNETFSGMAGACIAMHRRSPVCFDDILVILVSLITYFQRKLKKKVNEMVEQARSLCSQTLQVYIRHEEAGKPLSGNLFQCLTKDILPFVDIRAISKDGTNRS